MRVYVLPGNKGHSALKGGVAGGREGGGALLKPTHCPRLTFLADPHSVTGPKLAALPEPLGRHLIVGHLAGEGGTLPLHHFHILQRPHDLDISAWGKKQALLHPDTQSYLTATPDPSLLRECRMGGTRAVPGGQALAG